MGNRHQVFVIARVRPRGAAHDSGIKYRCIAALHHQWCSDTDPLEATRSFFDLVKQKENAEIIRAEIRSIDGKYDGPGFRSKMPRVPCSFTASLLAFAWNVDMERGQFYLSGKWPSSLLPASMGTWQGDNNEGITVIDVTSPDAPAFGFLRSKNNILTPAQYVRQSFDIFPAAGMLDGGITEGYSIESVEMEGDESLVEDTLEGYDGALDQFAQKAIAALEGEKMITLEMLAEAWPHEYTEVLRAANKSKGQLPKTSEEPQLKVPPLVEVALEQALAHAMQCGDTYSLEESLWLPGRADSLLQLLRKQSPFPDSAMSLLLKVIHEIRRTKSLDLSESNLSVAQLHQLIPALQDLRALNLSFNPNITVDVVRDLLVGVSSFRRLVIMGCPQVEANALCALMRSEPSLFCRLESLMHPALLDPSTSRDFPPAFSVSISIAGDPLRKVLPKNISSIHLPFCTPTSIVDGLVRVIDSMFDAPPYISYHSIVAQAALSSVVPPNGNWNGRIQSTVPSPETMGYITLFAPWTFVYEFDPAIIPRPIFAKWAFVRRKAAEKVESNIENHAGDGLQSHATTSVQGEAKSMLPEFDILDLRGFLRAMAEEGRDLPSEAAVLALEAVLKLRGDYEDISDSDTSSDSVTSDSASDSTDQDEEIEDFLLTPGRIQQLMGC
ncbi:hypothetical protein CERSUDRAFT_121640 [Gelatoporia subvermispora B]|uniref:Uncharacterized protein n=1 Tax=Ceriporiopsis subvermispora (strain B) TaxID=914234 RepID=M2R9H6_CERS8|nr:hypothetical protein CERSUDRAFT_121640 [Gelatoporia subvermispora B]